MMSKMRFELFDGIRGVAALFVLMRHTAVFWGIQIYRSYLAVDIFFVLSGFVIAYMYDARISKRELSVKQFSVLRLIRLYPIFALSVALAAAIWLGRLYVQHGLTAEVLTNSLAVIAATCFFLPSHFQSDDALFPLNGPFWSLFFELVVNFIYVLIRRHLTRRVHLAIIAVSAVVLVFVAFEHGNLDIGYAWGAVSLLAGAARSLFGFFTGVYLFLYRDEIVSYVQFIKFPAISLLVVVGVLALPSFGGADFVIDLICVCLVFPACALLASCDFKKSRAHSRLLTILGTASYPVYVLHIPMAKLLGTVLKKVPVPFSGLLLAAIVVALALLLERVYDLPLRKYLARKFLTPQPRLVPTGSQT